ncbi:hypothetical protein DFH94DRAFT_721437, partial [Russula ochroleuca]
MALWYTTVVQSTGTATAFAIGPIDYSYGADVLHLEHIFDTWGYGCPETHQVRRVARAIPSLRRCGHSVPWSVIDSMNEPL